MERPGTQVVRKKLASQGGPSYVQEAEALLEKREFAAALSVLEAGTKEGRKPIEALLALAEAHWELVHPKESIDFLKEAIQQAPKDARPFAQLGRYLLYKGLRDQALNFLDRAIALDPNDPETKKLRERAALNKKKAYTVVANAADFTAALGGEKKPVGATQMHKKEATRFLTLDPAKAAEELAKAESGAADEMDKALAALLGADLLNLDATLLKPEAARSASGGPVRTIIAFFVVALSGSLAGALAFQFGPRSTGAGAGGESVLELVRRDTASSLKAATDAMNDAEGTEDNGEAALAHALLLVEHGGDIGQLERAEQLLSANPAEKKTPHGLYARALMRLHPRAETDADLDEDVARAVKDDKTKDDPFVLLAAAARAIEKKDDAKASMLLHKAALGKNAPPRALHALARSYAGKGELQTARSYLDRLHVEAPLHAPSWATSVAIAILTAAKDGAQRGEPASKKDGERTPLPMTETETKARALIQDDKLPPLDAAELGLLLAAAASARGDGATTGAMLQRAGEQAPSWPGLAGGLAELFMLDLEVQKAADLLKPVVEKFPSEVELIADQTRARVLLGLSDARLRQLKLSATRSIEGDALRLPLGRFVLVPGKAGLPLSPVFDPRFFPESEIKTALDLESLTPQAAERRLDVVARLTLAELALAQGDVDKARDHVKAAREKTPSDPEVHLVDALVKKRGGDRVGSREAIEQALSVAPDDPRVLLAAARLQLDADDVKGARAALDTLAKEGFTSPTALALAAMVSLREGDAAEARRVVTDALAIGKDDLQVLRASLHVARAEQDVAKARSAAEQMYQSYPDGATQMADGDDVVKAYLAVLTAKREGAEAAKADVLAAAKVKATDADVQLLKGEVLAGTKDGKDDAILAYEKAAQLDPTGRVGRDARRAAAKLQGKAVPDEPEPAPPEEAPPDDGAALEQKETDKKPAKPKGKNNRRR